MDPPSRWWGLKPRPQVCLHGVNVDEYEEFPSIYSVPVFFGESEPSHLHEWNQNQSCKFPHGLYSLVSGCVAHA